ncbi:beta-1,3-galactosyltransferase 2-like [Labrus mixtus]|uniref:beta-1,3-galactosyltransferase 2-like n=1 Tax=Labrus mixtus TaxID=508554 RepID=UPI0029C02078|nr:beta-1,3-galactosyltransferase 2-like [Labrus mixtus]
MQWKRRHCCSYTATLFYLLSFLGVLLFLVQPRLTGMPWSRHHPVVYKGGELGTTKAKLNISTKTSGWRLVISPQSTVANISTHEKEVAPSPQGEPNVENTLSVSEEGEHRGNITPGPYTYFINEPDKCTESRSSPFLVLLITTEARQVEARNAIRQTWANESVAPTLGLIRLFLLGRNNGELGLLQQKMLEAESHRYHDIIQQDFRDTYNNLTIKTLMGLNWVAIYCPQASYVMKTDSDMFVNTEYLIYKLLRPEMKPKTNFFTGNNMRNFSPNRNKNSKWYMPPELYPGERYPTFCSGTGYVFSGDLATNIYRKSLSIPRLHLEDVYVGICLAKLGIEPAPPSNAFLFNHWRVSYSSCKYSHLITSHGFHPNEILKYWNHLQSTKNNACFNRSRGRTGRIHRNKHNKENEAH